MIGDDNSQGSLSLAADQLDLEHTLSNGQLFRWRRSKDGWWDVVTGGTLLRMRAVAGDKNESAPFKFMTYPRPADTEFVRDFLRLDVDLAALYKAWKGADPYLGSLGNRFAGLRIVRQDPEECLLSFICSTA